MIIREIKDSEMKEALELVWAVFLAFDAKDFTESGIKEFKDSIDNPDFIGRLVFFGAFINNELIGVIATRDTHHISQFFVAKDYQRQGVGKELYRYVCNLNKGNYFTVNSSPYAKSYYEHLGFRCDGDERCVNGIRFYPMIRKFINGEKN